MRTGTQLKENTPWLEELRETDKRGKMNLLYVWVRRIPDIREYFPLPSSPVA
jgi:hypothetical protein